MLAILHVASTLLARTVVVPQLKPPVVQLHADVQQSRSDMRSEPACLLWPHYLVSSMPRRLMQHYPR